MANATLNRPAGIFLPIPQEDEPNIPDDHLLGPYGLRARLVQVGSDAVAYLRPNGGTQQVGLNLFPANLANRATSRHGGGDLGPVDLVGILDCVETDERGKTWFGRVEEDELSELLIGSNGGVFSLSLMSPRFGIFATDPFSTQAGIYVLRQFDEDLLPDCGTEGAEPDDVEPDDVEPGASLSAARDDGSVFDLMVVYTSAVKNELGGQDGVEARICDSYRAGNCILGQSGLAPRLNLVHVEELPAYKEHGGKAGYYTMLAELSAGTATGLEGLHALRDKKHADIVTLLVFNPKLGGLANVPPAHPTSAWGRRAYNVVNYRVAASTYSMFHEIAHNCGCCHEDGCEHAPSYARGHVFEVGGQALKTVMVRKSVAGARTKYLSNPDVTYPGSNPLVPTGTAERNNARVLRQNADVVANFRVRSTAIVQT